MCQEAFIRWFSQDRVEEIKSPRAWLKTVVARLVISNYRRQKHRSGLERSLGDTVLAWKEPGFARMEMEELLDHLPVRDQILLRMKAGGCSYQEMAQAAGIAMGSVGTLLARALAKLREEYLREEGPRHAMPGSGKVVDVSR